MLLVGNGVVLHLGYRRLVNGNTRYYSTLLADCRLHSGLTLLRLVLADTATPHARTTLTIPLLNPLIFKAKRSYIVI